MDRRIEIEQKSIKLQKYEMRPDKILEVYQLKL